MALPDRIPVKISSEAAVGLSLTPVVRQELARAQLLENILRVTGKDAGRVREILRQGTVVNGASRFRWEAIHAEAEEVTVALAGFPDAEPWRPFEAARCVRARLAGTRAPIELEREAASRRRWLRRRSFWEAVLEAAAKAAPTYHGYSYGDRADVYHAELSGETAAWLREQSRLLPYESLALTIREASCQRLELWVERA